MAAKGSRMQNLLLYRIRVTIADGRQLTGQLLAFDKHMNIVLADCEEFRRIKRKQKTTTDAQMDEKRTLGLVILRGGHIVSMSVEAPPPTDNVGRTASRPTGPGIAKPMGRGMPLGQFAAMPPAGLGGPVRGVGGPAPPMGSLPYARPPPGPGQPIPGPPPGFTR